MLKTIVLVGFGGGIGSIARYILSLAINKQFSGVFPWGTWMVNLSGCLLIGLLMGYFGRQPGEFASLRLLLITGFCGGYTTFSTFSSENITLIQNGNTSTALMYMATSLLLGLAAVALGILLVSKS